MQTLTNKEVCLFRGEHFNVDRLMFKSHPCLIIYYDAETFLCISNLVHHQESVECLKCSLMLPYNIVSTSDDCIYRITRPSRLFYIQFTCTWACL